MAACMAQYPSHAHLDKQGKETGPPPHDAEGAWHVPCVQYVHTPLESGHCTSLEHARPQTADPGVGPNADTVLPGIISSISSVIGNLGRAEDSGEGWLSSPRRKQIKI